MMRSWPHHIHVTVYEALRETWEQKDIPESWKWRWRLPLPKVPDPSISQLRPFMPIRGSPKAMVKNLC